MNPQNKALQRTYFIGGPPRVGKSILAHKLAADLGAHVVSTDAIRDAVQKMIEPKTGDLFAVREHEKLSDEEWVNQHINSPKVVRDVQNRESKAFWPAILGFTNAFCEDNEIHIVEGVALLPEMVSKMEHRPEHVFYVGNTDANHFKNMISFAKQYPEWDWMSAVGYSDEKIKAMGNFVAEMSRYFKFEAQKYDFRYFEISDLNFDDSINKIIQEITSNKGNIMVMKSMKLYTDGGSRGNPGPAAAAFVIRKMDDNVVEKSGKYLGETTNNQAEYQALRDGLKRVKELGVQELEVYMDSELVVKQINGQYKVKKAELLPIYEEIKQMEKAFSSIKFIHVPRALNKEADAEVNRILDENH